MGNSAGNTFFSTLAVRLIATFTVLIIIIIGIGLGLSLAMTANIKNQEDFVELVPALPTKLLDINENLITEFASDEKREMVSLSELPKHLIHAVISREDPDFYNHRGFSIRAITRAVVGQIFKKGWGGGSTITQQVAGTLYCDRNERTYKRKIRELWWAFQIERRYTKNEILEIYLNYMPMGPGTYGVETASKYFFNHSSREVNLAESAVLAVLLSGPSRFDPLKNPNLARDRQHFVLERMIQFGYADKYEAEASFSEFWENFDYTRPPLSAYLTREDKAPWFSEYVRRELDVLMYGTRDYYRDGYVVHTTLNLAHQEAADIYIADGLERGNIEYAALNRRSNIQAERVYLPIVNLLTLTFDLTGIREASAGQHENRAVSRYTHNVNPVVDMIALVFDIPELKEVTSSAFDQLKTTIEQNVVEGALITIENETGYITAIGGSKYDESNQLIRATQASVTPGSAYKPLYYSAAIDSRQFTAASLIYDIPMAFHNEDSTPYIPNNYGGAWRGPLLLYTALALSLNIPALKVLETIGFDAAISRSATLLGITDEARIRSTFPRVYPLGLGIISVSPLQMARAFAVFANQGRDVTPIAIRTVEDRNGRVVFDIERDVRQRQRRLANNGQVVSPQNAYVMTRLMEFVVTGGTLAYGTASGSKLTYKDSEGKTFRMPLAGKSGTAQNWSDAWVVGYSPYYTTAMWYGFDKPGNSLGISQTGERLTAPLWGDYMSDIHKGLPQKSFTRPSGIYDVAVCRGSGLLMTDSCTQGAIYLPFMEGTVPSRYCDLHGSGGSLQGPKLSTTTQINEIDTSYLDNIPRPQLPTDLFPELQNSPSQPRQNQNQNQNNRTQNRNNQRTPQSSAPSNNNSGSNTGNQPAVIPDTAVRFDPREEDSGESDDEYLPPWNQLD
jgi:penicillin-binding protein 1A